MNFIAVTLYILMLTVCILLFLYNWAYVKQVVKARKELRVRFPAFLYEALHLNTYLSLAVSIVIIFLLVTRIGL